MQIMDFSSANCKNCYKCVRTCVVKAIEVKDDQAKIVEDRCVACGQCLVVCPQHARNILSHIDGVKRKIEEGENVIATLAPSYRGFYKESEKMITALRKLGFSSIQETSIGAELVSREYERLIKNTQKTEMITSCCPSVMMMIERYYPELIPNVLPVISPMIAHGKIIKSQNPNSYVVFIGPCFAKICESMAEGNVGVIDSVLTFDEINQWIEQENIDYRTLEETEPDMCGTLRGDRYPLVGGIINGIRDVVDYTELDVLRAHTMINCRTILEEIKNKNLHNVCVELSACNESCLGGPGGITSLESPYIRMQNVQRYVKNVKKNTNIDGEQASEQIEFPNIDIKRVFVNKRFSEKIPTEEEIVSILRQMGKCDTVDELNCSACGYNTCRDKAVAVYQGMSQVQMCLPNMRNTAERMSNKIFAHSPNAIIILNGNLIIEEINPTAEEVFGYKSSFVKGKQVSIIMDDTDFEYAINNKCSSFKDKISYLQYNYIAYRNIVYLEKQNALLLIFTGITEEEKRKNELAGLKQEMLAVTKEIIDKQMRTAQEIASLLGETTGETKVAFTKLKKVLEEEGDV